MKQSKLNMRSNLEPNPFWEMAGIAVGLRGNYQSDPISIVLQ